MAARASAVRTALRAWLAELVPDGLHCVGKLTGREYRNVRAGDSLSGVYKRMLTLSSGRYALIEQSREFVLVPWRPVLERARGQLVSGSVGGEGISWSIGMKRGIGR
ncbi:hypothetical protein ACVWZM_000223 [Bradyrhizobium sp. USDA 4501]|nr:DUF3363 domain-containing protein [Bradyrhizobium brasilense]NLS73365.1 DUF3363 domain-containing protein [Bradyrhizobium brasilense]